MLGSLGMPELVIILVLVMIVFGAGKLPNVMQSMGQGVREFRKASEGEYEGAEDAEASEKKPSDEKPTEETAD